MRPNSCIFFFVCVGQLSIYIYHLAEQRLDKNVRPILLRCIMSNKDKRTFIGFIVFVVLLVLGLVLAQKENEEIESDDKD